MSHQSYLSIMTLNVFVCVILFAIGLITLLNSPSKKENRAFFLSILSIIAWLLIRGASSFSEDADTLWIDRLAIGVSPFMALAFYFFTKSFLRPSQRLGLFIDRIALVIPVITFFLAQMSPFYLKEVNFAQGNNYAINIGSLYYFNTFFIAVLILYSVGLFIKDFMKEKSSLRRTALRLIIIGIGAAFLFNILPDVYFIMVRANGNALLQTFVSVSGLIIYALFVSYAMVKHGLFNIRRAVTRAAAYFFSFAITAVIYGLVIVVLARGVIIKDASSIEVGVMVAVVIFVTFTMPYVRQFFDRLTSKVFHRNTYDMKALLAALNDIFAKEVELQVIVKRAKIVLLKNLNAAHISIEVFDENQDRKKKNQNTTNKALLSIEEVQSLKTVSKSLSILENEQEHPPRIKKLFDKADSEVFVRLEIKAGLIGVMCLGKKKSGEIYDATDKATLDIVGHNLAIAMYNARQYSRIKQFASTLQWGIDKATRKLRVSNKKLNELARAKDDFISMASHQLLPQLSATKGFLDILAKESNKETNDLIQLMYVNVMRMTNLVSDMLNVTKLQSGDLVLEKSTVDVVLIIEEILVGMQLTISRNKFDVIFERPPHAIVQADEPKLREALFNIIDNAMQYSNWGGKIFITIGTKDSRLFIAVKDEGIGVSQEDKKHLFKKYYRAKNAQQKRPSGTGIGLFVAKKIFDVHDWEIGVHSSRGGGTQITVDTGIDN